MFGKSLIVSLAIFLGSVLPVAAKDLEPQIYYFGASDCDFCANGLVFIKRFKVSDERIRCRAFDIVASSDDAEAFVRVVHAIGLSDPRVTMAVVGHHVFVGYEGDDSTGEDIRLAVEHCRTSGCTDVVGAVLSFQPEVTGTSSGWIINRRSWKFATAR